MGAATGEKPTVWQMVFEAVQALGGSTTRAAVHEWIENKYPGTKTKTVDCQLCAGTVNLASRLNYSIDVRPRPANNPAYDRFFRPEKGLIELYDPERHGRWEIYQTEAGTLGVRQVEQWTRLPQPDASPSSSSPAADVNMVFNEVAWAAGLASLLETALQCMSFKHTHVRVKVGHRLPYAYEAFRYKGNNPDLSQFCAYQTDLLVFDEDQAGQTWIPRVVIECKVKGVTTHDALTYSTKAATHKHVHPYLRYGILVGSYGSSALPARLVRHGAYFDFMAVWEDADAGEAEWQELVGVLMKEVQASRQLESLFKTGKGKAPKPFRMLHRRLELRG